MILKLQNAFFRGRQIIGFIFIANENIYNILTSKELRVLYRVQIIKAYDHVNWELLLYPLKRCGSRENGVHGLSNIYPLRAFLSW